MPGCPRIVVCIRQQTSVPLDMRSRAGKHLYRVIVRSGFSSIYNQSLQHCRGWLTMLQ